MKTLFNKKTLEYNKDHIEGAYRIKKFSDFFENHPCSAKKGLEYLKLIYSKEYIENIRNSFLNRETIAEVETKEVYFDIACMSVDLAVQASEIEGFGITRPPGHHANENNPQGFCFFNNIAISVERILQEQKSSKVCIVDIDGHHGNGTQDIFEKNPRVLYCSVHQENTYPFSGFLNEKNSLNFPLSPKSGDDILKNTMNLFKEKISSFKPNYIAISAGFDGYYKDALLDLDFSKRGFYEVGNILGDIEAKVFCCLEGGYHNEILECHEELKNGLQGKKYNSSEEFRKSPPHVLEDYFKKEEIFKTKNLEHIL